MTAPITRFSGDYDFLSNFYPCAIELDGVLYPTVEHAFQAAKTFDADERYKIQVTASPASAKRVGSRVRLRDDWEQVKFGIMEELVRYKFTSYPELGVSLLETAGAELIEGNTWNDRTWGMTRDRKSGQWIGKNHLGRILMQVRDELTSSNPATDDRERRVEERD